MEGIEGESKEYVGMMEDQLTKLDKVIMDIINIRKIAKSGLQEQNLDLKELILQIYDSIKFLEHFNEIDKKLTIKGDSKFIQDKNNLQIILNNLLSNSVKYASKSRANKYINIEIEIDESMCKIVLEDNGIGIHSSRLDKIFDMFYRATDRNTGTGLGLFIVKRVCNDQKV